MLGSLKHYLFILVTLDLVYFAIILCTRKTASTRMIS